LAEGDILVVPHKDPRWGNVEIVGAVQAGGMFDFVEGERVADLLSLADGLAPNADTTRIEVWRFIPGGDSALPLKRRANETLNEFYQTPLESDDRIIVRETRDFRPRRAVRVTGEVLRPGVYAFSGDSTFLRDVIDSAGGVTVSADLAHARIIRTGNKLPPEERQLRVASVPTELRTRTENEWLLADILSEPGRVVTDFVALFEHGDEAFNVALFSGDQVHIPPQTASVSVIGRVVQPGLVPYRAGEDVSYYLERAGGFSWQADRGSTFLVKGTTGAAVKRGRIKAIDAGDTIVIPTKRDKNFWRSFRETLVVVSSLATVYLVIDQATQ
ncbi:MAG TPA: SLBB domain-containing protein, partial [candidate division Zixibacteria bacterium]|nr:SLBB domain-containing protein [candidate division Zixibacteria bacterium]